ncbi:MAG: hypothetical protein M9947_01360 [Thermomicrobiales bacterium]|nr:hypothetical protein [Thermomicrobiales bacterium]
MRGWRGAVCSALVVLLVVSCSTGDARDERKFEAQEAKRTQQVPAVQQTELANTFLQPTGTPMATYTPRALLSELVITTGLDASGAPTNDVSSVSQGQSVTLAARLTALTGGETITVQWLDNNGTVLASADQIAEPTSGPRWFTSTWQPAGVPSGIYAAAVRINGDLLDSITFRVG